jgi:SAM-dependent MidA family methyltransferase
MTIPPQNIAGLPEPDKASAEHSKKLVDEIQRQIDEKGGSIPFSVFMNLALYAPSMGYYVAGQQRFGKAGDFVTAPMLGNLFGACLARQIVETFKTIGGDCSILEFGAGSGALAATLLQELADHDSLPARYLILEPSPDLQHQQQRTIEQVVPQHADRVAWLESIPAEPLTGVIVANEVLDAMPVELFTVDDAGTPQQLMVTTGGNGFKWDSKVATGVLADKITNLSLPPGYSSELNPAIDGWVSMLSKSLEQGVALLIDYGFPRAEYYHPQRTGGTLMCHFRHHAHTDPLIHVGIQDITAHVDFTAVAEAALVADLHVAGYTTQAHFLLSCGLTEMLANDDMPMAERMAANHQIQILTSPAEMGELFKVMALTKNYASALSGFSMRDMRGAL